MKSKKLIFLLFLAFALSLTSPTLSQEDPKTYILPYDIEVKREMPAETLEPKISIQALVKGEPFWVDMVNAEAVSNEGEGVYVAVLDTGLLEMWPFFFSEADIQWELGKGFTHDVWWDAGIGDFVFDPLRDDRGFITKPFEGSGHGTHVTSTIVGYNFNNEFWVKGVAPKVKIIPVLVLDAWAVSYPGGTAYFTGGTGEMISAGIYYIADMAETLDGPVIINMSLGGSSPSSMIEDAIDYAISKGVMVVVAAGNAGYDGMHWPGAFPQVISCAMAGWTENWVTYPLRWWLNDVSEDFKTPDYWGNNWQLFLDYLSSRPNKGLGQKKQHLDVAAPGCAIVGPYKSYFETFIGYYYLWGTSMATPHVSAMAALVAESHNYDQLAMEKTLKLGASGLPLPCDGSLAFDFPGVPYFFEWIGRDWGSGFLRADAALKKAK